MYTIMKITEALSSSKGKGFKQRYSISFWRFQVLERRQVAAKAGDTDAAEAAMEPVTQRGLQWFALFSKKQLF